MFTVLFSEISELKSRNKICFVASAVRNEDDEPFMKQLFVVSVPRQAEFKVRLDRYGRMIRLDGVAVDPDKTTGRDEQIGWRRERVTRNIRKELTDIVVNEARKLLRKRKKLYERIDEIRLSRSRDFKSNRLNVVDDVKTLVAEGAKHAD